MNKEEKKAIEYLKARLYGNEGCKFIDVAQSDLRIFLNLVDRQQKEIEKYEQQIDLEFVEKNFIEKNKVVSKDKIREKIKELEEIADEDNPDAFTKIDAYEELLEEK